MVINLQIVIKYTYFYIINNKRGNGPSACLADTGT